MPHEPIPLQPLEVVQSQLFTDEHYNAWNIVYTAQEMATLDSKEVVHARIVGHLLLELCHPARRRALGDRPSSHLAGEITTTGYGNVERHRNVYDLGERYLHHLLCSFWTESTRSSPLNSAWSSSPPSFERIEDQVSETLKQRESMSEEERRSFSSAREMTFARDGFRCVLTGIIDVNTADHNRELSELALTTKTDTHVLKACHVLHIGTQRNVFAMSNEMERTAGVLTILRMFGLEDIANALVYENGVDSPQNLVTMSPLNHFDFEALMLWFEETEIENVYTIGCRPRDRYKLELRGVKDQVNFNEPPDTCKFPDAERKSIIPDRRLLALHASCARVLHMSGAAALLDQLVLDAEESEVLMLDGSSAGLLSVLLTPLAPYP